MRGDLAIGLAVVIIGWLELTFLLAARAWDARVQRHKAIATPVQTCAQLRRAPRLPRRVAVAGEAVPGPLGAVAAPITGEKCVAFSVVVTSQVEGESGTYPHPIYQRKAPDLAGIADGTATVLLSSRMLDRVLGGSGAAASVSTHHESLPMDTERWPSGSFLAKLRRERQVASHWFHRKGSAGFAVDERILRSGVHLVAIGRPSRRGGDIVLDKGRGEVTGIAASTLAEVHEQYATALARRLSWLRRVILTGGILASLGVAALALT